MSKICGRTGLLKFVFWQDSPLEGGPSLVELLKSGADARSAIASIKYSATLTRAAERGKRNFGPAEKAIRVSGSHRSRYLWIRAGDLAENGLNRMGQRHAVETRKSP